MPSPVAKGKMSCSLQKSLLACDSTTFLTRWAVCLSVYYAERHDVSDIALAAYWIEYFSDRWTLLTVMKG